MNSSYKAPRHIPLPPSAEAKGSLYTRFIPREELNAFAAWSPGSLAIDEPAGPVAAAHGPAAASEAPEHVAEQLKRARQSGYQDGYRDGLVALEGFKQSFAQQTTVQVGALVRAIGGQLDALQQQMAEALAAAAVALARQVVRSELDCRPEAVALVAAEALDTLLLSARHITLRVHPDDVGHVTQGAGEALAARGARVVGDGAIARGGCLIDSNIGAVDASVATRWRRAVAALGSDATWADDGATAAPPAAP